MGDGKYEEEENGEGECEKRNRWKGLIWNSQKVILVNLGVTEYLRGVPKKNLIIIQNIG